MLITYKPFLKSTGEAYSGTDIIVLLSGGRTDGQASVSVIDMTAVGDGSWTYELEDTAPGYTTSITCTDAGETCVPLEMEIVEPVTDIMAILIADLRARGYDDAADISDATLTTIINASLGEYSRYRPLANTLIFQTVENKVNYSFTEMGDANGQEVILTMWNVDGINPDNPLAHAALCQLLNGLDYHLPSQKIVEDIKLSEYHKAFQGTGHQRDKNGGDLYLTPCPAQSDTSVYVRYTKPHTTVDTIPVFDRDIFLDFVDSLCSERVIREIAKKSAGIAVKTPEYEVKVGEQIGYWRKNAQEMRARFTSKIQAGEAAVART